MHPDLSHLPLSGRGTSGASGSAMRTISVRTAWKSAPPFELKAPGTFSHTMNLGLANRISTSAPVAFRISFTIRICSIKSPDRSPSSPALFPATLKSWQGLPPVMMSTGGILSPWIFCMSPRCSILSLSPFFTGLPTSEQPGFERNIHCPPPDQTPDTQSNRSYRNTGATYGRKHSGGGVYVSINSTLTFWLLDLMLCPSR